MTPGRKATVQMISEEEATGKVAEIYADIKTTKGIPVCPKYVAYPCHPSG